VYNKTAYRDMHKVAAPILRAAFPNIRFIGSEDVFGWHFNDWIPTVFGDPTAGPYFYAAAGHYGDAGEYTQAHGGASNYGKVIWGSEETHNGSASSLGGAIGQAERLHWAVVNGHATGWIIWVMNSMFDDQRHPLWTYYGAKHFWRFVRPGAKRIAATGGSSSFLVSAFKHTGDNTMTVVVVNKSGANTLQLSGSGLPAQFYKYETDASKKCVMSGTVSSSASIPIAGNSVTTLHSADISPVMRRAAGGVPRTRQFTGPVRVYGLDGRLIGRGERPMAGASAVRLIVGRDARRVLTVGR
jgi:O-glycosyl hydrolase